MSLREDLAGVVGAENVTNNPDVLDRYSRDDSLCKPCRPREVVYAGSTAEVQAVMKYACLHSVPVTPRSSAVGFHGAGIPGEGGIILDLRRMNKVLNVDAPDKSVRVEPGVTWPQLQDELAKHGLMACNPLLPHRDKSALTSAMEREPILIPKSEYNDTLLTAEMVLPNGDMFWTGTALGKGMISQTFPEGPIPSSTRMFLGAQGTFGIMTWANIKVEWRPLRDKMLFIPLHSIDDVAEPVYQLQRRMIGSECFVIDSLNLASILALDTPNDMEQLRASSPPFVLVLCLSGFHIMPEGRVEYEEEAVMEIAMDLGLKVGTGIPEVPGAGHRIFSMLRNAWPGEQYWKHRHKGACQDILFYTTFDRIVEFTEALREVAAKHDYPAQDISVYLQPVERARACYCEFGLHYSPETTNARSRANSFFLAASEKMIDLGGFFSTPYGPWADMVYSRATAYTGMIRTVKKALDPANVMNPGKLCF